MEIKGKIIKVLDKKSGTSQSGKQWCSQEYVLETSGEYPKHCCFSVFGEDRINEFDIKNGDDVTIHIEIDAREWKDRWFNSIRAYKCYKDECGKPSETKEKTAEIFPPKEEIKNELGTVDDNDSLPF
jgi:hypothetical protein